MLVNVTKSHIKKEPRYKEQKVKDREKFTEVIEKTDESTICWVDQCGVDKYYNRSRGRALRGKRIYANVPGKRYKRTNIIAGYLNGKVIAPFQYDGTTKADLVEGWFECHLLPAIPKGTTIPIDSASFHRKNVLRDITEDSGCYLISLPTYSPDLNKIEYAIWANMKNHLRNYSKNFKSLDDALIDYFQFK
jgi:transposase